MPLLLVVAISTNLKAQTESKKIEQTVTGFFNGMSLYHGDSLKYYSTPDFQLLENGEVWDMHKLISVIEPRKKLNITRINQFSFIRIEIKGKMGWVSYHNTAEFSQGEKNQVVNWLESAVLIKQKGRWKIQLLHSSKLK